MRRRRRRSLRWTGSTEQQELRNPRHDPRRPPSGGVTSPAQPSPARPVGCHGTRFRVDENTTLVPLSRRDLRQSESESHDAGGSTCKPATTGIQREGAVVGRYDSSWLGLLLILEAGKDDLVVIHDLTVTYSYGHTTSTTSIIMVVFRGRRTRNHIKNYSGLTHNGHY